ncbi:shikimate kinase [Mucilaginibacter sp.]|uniref:shikimate kinase n=1 Tax=Mucilaginibacter sp. TaxID=1882438 RepID=UPI0035BBDAF5
MSLIFLTGFMGCGKTSWGRKLAAAVNYHFIDLDHKLEADAEMTVAQYFAAHGEEKFRRLESEILKTTVYPEKTVISTGGGLPCFYDNMEWMNNHGETLYIQLSAKALANRLENAKTPRPVLQGKKGDDLITFIDHKLAERESFYLQAKHIVNGIDMSLEVLKQTLGLL